MIESTELQNVNQRSLLVVFSSNPFGVSPDMAIVEALIEPDPVFVEVCYRGVPDARIVVYRGFPAMSMVRLPTRASDGKANLHRGAIATAIDIGEGITLAAVHRAKIIKQHPDTGKAVGGIVIPYRDKMLSMAASAMEMTGLGYLGVDLVIDRYRGPVLLELNARPGLAIQLTNNAGLLNRLIRVDQAQLPKTYMTSAAELLGLAGNLQ